MNNKILKNLGFILGIILIIVSISTYIKPIMNGNSDFGLFFEILSLILLLVAQYFFNQHNISDSKTYIKWANGMIIFLLIYDIFVLLLSTTNIFQEIGQFLKEELLFLGYICTLTLIDFSL